VNVGMMLGRKAGRVMTARKGFLVLSSATAVGQILTLLILPILTRLYTPEEFGVLTFVASTTAIMTPFALLRMDSALLLPEDSVGTRPLVHIALLGVTVASVLLALGLSAALFLFADEMGEFPGLQLWLPLMLFTTAILALQNQLVFRERRYGLAAGRGIVQSITISGSQLALPMARGIGINGLVLGTLVGSFIGNVLLIKNSLPYLGRPNWREMKHALRRYWKFPVVFAPSTGLVLIGQQAPLLFVVVWFGTGAGGQIGLAERIVAVPLTLIGLSVGSVLDSEMSKRIRAESGAYDRLYMKTSGYLLAIGCTVAVVLGIFGPALIVFVFGEEWQLAADAAQVMAITAGIRMVVNPTRKLLTLFERSRATILLECARLLLVAIAVASTIQWNLPLITCLWAMYVSLSVIDAITWIYGARVARAESGKIA